VLSRYGGHGRPDESAAVTGRGEWNLLGGRSGKGPIAEPET